MNAWRTLAAHQKQGADLFGEPRCLEITVADKIPTEAIPYLDDWLNSPPDKVTLIFYVEKQEYLKPDLKSRLARCQIHWAKPLLTESALVQWVKQRAKVLKLKLEEGAIYSLVRYTEGNLLATQQCLEKLQLVRQGLITETDLIQYLCGDHILSSAFLLIRALLSRRTEKMFRILAKLKSEGTDAAIVLWAITRELRIIIRIANAIQQNQPLQTACLAQGLWESQVSLYKYILNTIPFHRFYQLLSQAHQVDRAIKGLSPTSAYQTITELLRLFDAWLNRDRVVMA